MVKVPLSPYPNPFKNFEECAVISTVFFFVLLQMGAEVS